MIAVMRSPSENTLWWPGSPCRKRIGAVWRRFSKLAKWRRTVSLSVSLKARFAEALHGPTFDGETERGFFGGEFEDKAARGRDEAKESMKCSASDWLKRGDFFVQKARDFAGIDFGAQMFAAAQRFQVKIE